MDKTTQKHDNKKPRQQNTSLTGNVQKTVIRNLIIVFLLSHTKILIHFVKQQQ